MAQTFDARLQLLDTRGAAARGNEAPPERGMGEPRVDGLDEPDRTGHLERACR